MIGVINKWLNELLDSQFFDCIKRYNLDLVLAFAGLFFYYNLNQYLNLGPCSVHTWRQADSASFALSYYNQESIFLLKPQILNQESIDGKAASEFPIIYYLVSWLYWIFGPNDGLFRMFSLGLFCTGLIYFKKTILLWTNDYLLSSMLAIIPLLSPLLVFYSFGFIPNTSALAVSLIAGYYSMSYFQHKKEKDLFWGLAFWTLAGLIKITTLIGFLPFYFFWFWEVTKENSTERFFNKPRLLLVYMSLVVIIDLCWVIFAKNYNQINNSSLFLMDIKPYWRTPQNEIDYIWYRYETEWVHVVFHPLMIKFYYGLIALVVLFSFKISAYARFYFIVLSILTSLVVILWFNQIIVHDYYIIDWFPLVFFVLLAAAPIISKLKLNKIVYVLILYVMVISVHHAKKVIDNRYDINNPDRTYLNQSFYKKQDLQRYMKEIGLTKEKMVVSIPDKSPNITLYFLNRKGWTNINIGESNIGPNIVNLKNSGAEYLIISNQSVMTDSTLKPLLNNKIGEFDGSISFYKL